MIVGGVLVAATANLERQRSESAQGCDGTTSCVGDLHGLITLWAMKRLWFQKKMHSCRGSRVFSRHQIVSQIIVGTRQISHIIVVKETREVAFRDFTKCYVHGGKHLRRRGKSHHLSDMNETRKTCEENCPSDGVQRRGQDGWQNAHRHCVSQKK